MGEGRSDSGHSAEATVSFFQPARNSILILLGAAALAGPLFEFLVQGAPGLGVSLRFAVMLFAAAAIALTHLRDPVLALSVLLAPLTAVSLVVCAAPSLTLLLPTVFLAAFVYALGFVVALMAGSRFALRIADGEDREVCTMAAMRADPRGLASILVFASATFGIFAIHGPAATPLLLAAGNALAILTAWFAVPLAGSFMVGGEDFIAQTNRVLESRQVRLERIAKAAQPPWALSVTGILVVLLALASFGSAGIAVARDVRAALWSNAAGAFVVLAIAAYLAAGAWRSALAVWLGTASAVLFGVWGYARTGAIFDAPLSLATAELCTIFFVPIALVAASASFSNRNDAVGASESGLSNAGAAAVTAFFAMLVLLAPWYREIGVARAGFVLAIVFAAGVALIFQPAITRALKDIVPRRRNL